MRKKRFVISGDGTITGLWDDCLEGLGSPKVTRASKVEFNEEAGGWTVEICIGDFSGCYLPKVFPRRKEALNSEVEFFYKESAEGRLHKEL